MRTDNNESETTDTVPFTLDDLVAPSSVAISFFTPPPRSSQIVQADDKDLVSLRATPICVRPGSCTLDTETIAYLRMNTNAMIRGDLKKRILHRQDVNGMLTTRFPEVSLPLDPTDLFVEIIKYNEGLKGDFGPERSGYWKVTDAEIEKLPKFMRDLSTSVFREFLVEPPEGVFSPLSTVPSPSPPISSEHPPTSESPSDGSSSQPDNSTSNDSPPDKKLEPEDHFRGFVDRICKFAEYFFPEEFKKWSVKRKWSSAFHSKAPKTEAADITSLPDFVLVDSDTKLTDEEQDGDRLPWLLIKIAGELKAITNTHRTEPAFLKEVIDQLNNYVLAIFESQDDRRFIPTFALVGIDICLSFYDRSCALHSLPFDISKYPLSFLHLILGLTYAADHHIGYDPNFFTDKEGNKCLNIAGHPYKIKKRIFRSLAITGRATKCWVVVDENGKEHVVKDYWAMDTRAQTEINHLLNAQAAGVKGIPTILAHEDVNIFGMRDTTNNNHGLLSSISERVHKQILFAKHAVPLSKFGSLWELLSAIIDILYTHKSLIDDASILHCDISIANMMLYCPDGVEVYPRRGLLIDFDYSMDLDKARKKEADDNAVERYRSSDTAAFAKAKAMAQAALESKGKGKKASVEFALTRQLELEKYEERLQLHGMRTGTHPFIAADILGFETKVATLETELESFYYVVLYFALLFDGPGKQKIGGTIPKFFHEWLHPETLPNITHIGGTKLIHKKLDANEYSVKVLRYLTDYMAPISGCLAQLHEAMKEKETFTHENFIRILKDTRDKLPIIDQDEEDEEDEEVDEVSESEDSSNGGDDINEQEVFFNPPKGDDDGTRTPASLVEYSLKPVKGAFENTEQLSEYLCRVRIAKYEGDQAVQTHTPYADVNDASMLAMPPSPIPEEKEPSLASESTTLLSEELRQPRKVVRGSKTKRSKENRSIGLTDPLSSASISEGTTLSVGSTSTSYSMNLNDGANPQRTKDVDAKARPEKSRKKT